MNLTLKDYVEKVSNWKIGIKEVFNFYLQKAKKENEKLNAFVRFNENQDIDENKLKETILKWAPIWVKDNFLTKQDITSCGSKMLENYISPYDATTYKQMKENWWVMIWKTNMDEFAMGSSTETSYFGPTKNPHDIKKVPWWSSWGSAAAVAADLCLAALGTDTWWSIRQPASLCWVVGFKPTYGRNSRYWVVAMASSLDQVWTFTKTVEDCVMLSKILAWKDPLDATSISKNDLHLWDEALKKDNIKDLRIAVPKQFFEKWIDDEVKDLILKTMDKISNLWATVEYVDMNYIQYALEVYYIIVPAEVSTNLARFDWIRFGFGKNSFDFKNIYDYYENVRSEWFGDEAKRRIMLWTYVLSAGYYDAFYNKASKIRKLIKNEYDNIFSSYDLILWPVSPTVAWNIWEKINDPVKMYLSDIYTIPVNLAWLPAMSLPIGKVNNLPVWLHVVANQWQEHKIFHLANILEKV